MKDASLFPPQRTCIVCERSATPGAKRIPGEPNVLAVSMTVYRRGTGKGQLKAAPKVNICEECFIKSVQPSSFSWVNPRGQSFFNGLKESLSRCYSAIVEAER